LLHPGAHGKGVRVKGPPARQEESKEQLPALEGIISDAGELEPGDRVVYPNQGVCRIKGVESKEIAGQKLELVRMEREEDGAAVLVPKGKVPTIGLRKVASGDQIEGVFHYLAAQYDDPELDWKVRHRDNADRLIAGGVLGVAEVVKGLHALSRIRPLPAKEREQYDNARHLLVHEVAVSLAVPPALAEDYVDYALMPPVGVTFKLKPPPKPVELPSRPRRRVTRTDDEDLGLDELGLDIDLPEVPGTEAEAPDAAEAAPEESAGALPDLPDTGVPAAEGESDELEGGAEPAEEEEGEEEPAPRRGKRAPAPRPEAAARPAAEKKKPPAARKPEKPAKAAPRPPRPERAEAKPKPEKKKPAPKPAKKAPPKGSKKK
jgi:CarD family transcriptional regulator, regulator of rRNA transcription